MNIHLYQQSSAEAFRLCERVLLKTGFAIQLADDIKGIISARKQLKRNGQFIFLDVLVKGKKHETTVAVISNVFSGSSGTFIADAVSEELFLETFHDMLRIHPPDNPLKLSSNDYAMAVGF